MGKKLSFIFMILCFLVVLICVDFKLLEKPFNPINELSVFESEKIVGGSSLSSGSTGGKTGGGKGSSSGSRKYDNITLSNVPYYCQNSKYSSNYRANYYCGLACCMMIRNMGKVGSSLYYNNLSQSQVDRYMQSIDDELKSISAYLTFNSLSFPETVDVAEYGLLFYDANLDADSEWDDSSRRTLFLKTGSLIRQLYTDNSFSDIPLQGFVDNANIRAMIPSEVKRTIWNHIKEKNQPVVVVMDSECTDALISRTEINGMTYEPLLHYNVIVGIKEDSTGEYFVVNDPWLHSMYGSGQMRVYKADDYVKSMCINEYVQPQWVFNYVHNAFDETRDKAGCYFLLVNE